MNNKARRLKYTEEMKVVIKNKVRYLSIPEDTGRLPAYLE